MITETDKAYIAGILDTQAYPFSHRGTLTVRMQRSRSRLRESQGQVYSYLSRMTGLNNIQVRRDAGKRKGCVEHCPEAHVHIMPYDSFCWQVYSARAFIVLHNVERYMFTWDRFESHFVKEITRAARWPCPAIYVMQDLGWELPLEAINRLKDAA